MAINKKRHSRIIKLGGNGHVKEVLLGGKEPIVIQTMWKDRLLASDLKGAGEKSIRERLEVLEKLGCGALRFAVPDEEAASLLGHLSKLVSLPLIADIHFDYKIALRCLDFPIAKIRINPGNIGGAGKVRAVLSKAKDRGVPLRIGINAGSLPRDLSCAVEEAKISRAKAMVKAALREIELFNENQFTDFLVSMKASSIADTIKANQIFARQSDVPLHIGVTEAGPLIAGVVRSTAALMVLLKEGIGETIRVSLSDTMENEVIAGREILAAVTGIKAKKDSKNNGITIVSCPRCGRNTFDTHAFTEKWQTRLYSMDKKAIIAIMGCSVNGPGESAHADLGITGLGNKVVIFRNGKVTRTVGIAEADDAFREEIEKL